MNKLKVGGKYFDPKEKATYLVLKISDVTVTVIWLEVKNPFPITFHKTLTELDEYIGQATELEMALR